MQIGRTKRQKELAREEKRKEKELKKEERKKSQGDRPARDGDVDPDIAGIVPGPQPKEEDGSF